MKANENRNNIQKEIVRQPGKDKNDSKGNEKKKHKPKCRRQDEQAL